MRRSRIYTPRTLTSQDIVEVGGSAGHYLTRVLRLSVGDIVTLFNGDGLDHTAEICGITRQNVMLKLKAVETIGSESRLKITLVQAISRGERMDYCVQKATELGVSAIQPVMSRRVEVRLDNERQAKRVAHWQGVVISACEQNGRAVVPVVKMPLSLEQWIDSSDGTPRLVLDPDATQKLSALEFSGEAVSILVGPEGGFTDQEIALVIAKGAMAVSLGPRVLRTETAGPVAIALLQVAAGYL